MTNVALQGKPDAGTLEVVAYKDGREWARDKVKTTGAPVRLEAMAETPSVGLGPSEAEIVVLAK